MSVNQGIERITKYLTQRLPINTTIIDYDQQSFDYGFIIFIINYIHKVQHIQENDIIYRNIAVIW